MQVTKQESSGQETHIKLKKEKKKIEERIEEREEINEEIKRKNKEIDLSQMKRKNTGQ